MVTKRDRVWAAALELARAVERPEGPTVKYSQPGFNVEHVVARLAEDEGVEVAKRTIRATLDSMARLDVLHKRAGKGQSYSEYRFPLGHPLRDSSDSD